MYVTTHKIHLPNIHTSFDTLKHKITFLRNRFIIDYQLTYNLLSLRLSFKLTGIFDMPISIIGKQKNTFTNKRNILVNEFGFTFYFKQLTSIIIEKRFLQPFCFFFQSENTFNSFQYWKRNPKVIQSPFQN